MNKITDTGMPALMEAGGGYDPIEDRLRQTVRAIIETLFEEELEAFIGRCRYGRGRATSAQTTTPTGRRSVGVVPCVPDPGTRHR